MSRLSVLIVNYRSGHHLASCLRSLAQNTEGVDYDVCIINNDLPQDLEPISQLDLTQVQILQNPSNLGLAAAVNQGYRRSQAPLLLLLNPDVWVERGALDVLAATLDAHPEAGIVIPRLKNPDGSLQYSCRRFYTVSTLLMRRGPFQNHFSDHPRVRCHLMADWDHQKLSEVDWGLGAAMLIRRAALDDEFLLDERFFLYFEDVDLCKSMWQRGWKVLYDPAASMVHNHRRDSAAGGRPGAKRHHFLSLLKFLWKHRFRLGGPSSAESVL